VHVKTAGSDCSPKATPDVKVDRPLDHLFSHQFGPGWVGGDATYSTALPGGREAFVFSDTVIGHAKPDGSTRITGLIHNSELVGSLTHLKFDHGGNLRSPRPLIPDTRGRVDQWQVASTYVARSRQLVFVNEFAHRPGPFERFTGRSALAVLSLTAHHPPEFRAAVALPSDPEDQWGNAVVRSEAYMYIYGSVDDPSSGTFVGMKVARVPPGDSLRTRAWRYWDGSTWVAGVRRALTIRTGNELTGITAQRGIHGYAAVSIPESVRTDRALDISYACSPQGPWSDAVAVYTIPEVQHFGDEIAYIPTFHPELAGRSGTVISYNVDTLGGLIPLRMDIHVYQPRFLRLTYEAGRRLPTPTVVIAEFHPG